MRSLMPLLWVAYSKISFLSAWHNVFGVVLIWNMIGPGTKQPFLSVSHCLWKLNVIDIDKLFGRQLVAYSLPACSHAVTIFVWCNPILLWWPVWDAAACFFQSLLLELGLILYETQWRCSPSLKGFGVWFAVCWLYVWITVSCERVLRHWCHLKIWW